MNAIRLASVLIPTRRRSRITKVVRQRDGKVVYRRRRYLGLAAAVSAGVCAVGLMLWGLV